MPSSRRPTTRRDTKGPTDPFTFGPFTLRPSESDRIEAGIKPGHWTMATQEVRANFDDFRGELVTEVVQAGGDGVDLDGQTFHLRSSRPAVLPKTQKKLLDIAMFNPVDHFSRQVAPRLLSRSGRDVWNARELLIAASRPNSFSSSCLPGSRTTTDTCTRWIRFGCRKAVRRIAARRRITGLCCRPLPWPRRLPSHALFWTSTAVLLWDGLDPALLTTAQQQALVDWLHWGGQLIVSGPDSLELPRDTFLDGVMPAAAGESWEMSEETLAALWRMSPDADRKLRSVSAVDGPTFKSSSSATPRCLPKPSITNRSSPNGGSAAADP